MGQLSGDKEAVLRRLAQTAPDAALFSLERALKGAAGDPALRVVSELIAKEAANRRVRDTVLSPLSPLFARQTGLHPTFPPSLLRQLWAALESWRVKDVKAATAICLDPDSEIDGSKLFDHLCAAAAHGLRTSPTAGFAALAADPATPQLIACLDLAGVVRAALPHLGDWVTRMNDDRKAAIRLAYKDAVMVSDDAGPLFFAIMDSHLHEPWLILRVISAAMDRPGEVYLAGSDLVAFAVRALDDIDTRLEQVRTFDPRKGVAAGRTAGQSALSAAWSLAEFEDAIELSRDHPWGKGIAARRKTLAGTVEARLGEIEAAAIKALPMTTLRTGRKSKDVPRVDADPDAAAVEVATALLAFCDEVRSGAGRGGYGSVRTRIVEALCNRLDTYVEDLLELVKSANATESARIHSFLTIAADFYALAKDQKSAHVIRRRAASAQTGDSVRQA